VLAIIASKAMDIKKEKGKKERKRNRFVY